MKKLFVSIIMMLCICSFCDAQKVIREGNTFTTVSTKTSNETKTQFTWKNKGVEYPIYVGKSGACYIKKVSKTGKEYKQYLGAEISSQICRELGIKYIPKTK